MARQSAKFVVASGGKKTLPTFNIRLGKRRTSVRMSPVVADAVANIAAREGCDLNELYTYIDRKKKNGISRSTAIRDFALRYFMEAGTKAGHRKAGHGKIITKHDRRVRRSPAT